MGWSTRDLFQVGRFRTPLPALAIDSRNETKLPTANQIKAFSYGRSCRGGIGAIPNYRRQFLIWWKGKQRNCYVCDSVISLHPQFKQSMFHMFTFHNSSCKQYLNRMKFSFLWSFLSLLVVSPYILFRVNGIALHDVHL